MCDLASRFLFLIFLFAGYGSAAGANATPVLNDWFALGSGCRARSDLAGNVEMTRQDSKERTFDIHKARFIIKDFQIEKLPAANALSQFGRECAIRLNINPPAGKKILAIRAHTKIDVKKSLGYNLDLLSELKLGPVSLGSDSLRLQRSETSRTSSRLVALGAGRGQSAPLPQLGCGEPKIIGFDYSWIVSDKVSGVSTDNVMLGGDKSLLIEVVLGSCSE